MGLNSGDQVKCHLVHRFVAGEWWNGAGRGDLRFFGLVFVIPLRSNSMTRQPVPPRLLTRTRDDILLLGVEPDRHLADAGVGDRSERNLSSGDDAAALPSFGAFHGLFFGYLYNSISSNVVE